MTMNLQTATRRWTRPWFPWLIVLAAFGLRVIDLSAQSLWYDEAFSVIVARADWATATRLLSVDLHPPLYYLVLRAGLAAFGSSEFVVRFVSVVPAVLMAPLVWVLARRLFDRLTAHLSAALVCLSPLFVWYGREARMYSQTTMLGLAATYSLVRAQDSGQARWWRRLLRARWARSIATIRRCIWSLL